MLQQRSPLRRLTVVGLLESHHLLRRGSLGRLHVVVAGNQADPAIAVLDTGIKVQLVCQNWFLELVKGNVLIWLVEAFVE